MQYTLALYLASKAQNTMQRLQFVDHWLQLLLLLLLVVLLVLLFMHYDALAKDPFVCLPTHSLYEITLKAPNFNGKVQTAFHIHTPC